MRDQTPKQKKKILFVITKSNWGGAQKYVYDLATGLPSSKFDIVVACGGNGLLVQKLHAKNIITIEIPRLQRDIRLRDEIRVFFWLTRIFREERPDIIHLNSSKIGGLGALAGRFARVPKIIFTAHGWYFKERRHYVIRAATYILSWITVLLSHVTITVSEDDHIRAPSLFVSKKIVRIHNGINTPTFLDRDSARKILYEHGVNEDAMWIGSVAELHKNKGLIAAIDAMRELVDGGIKAYFFIIGEGEERKTFERRIKERALQNHVFLLGHIDNAPRFIPAFDVFLLPSYKEGLPYTILEAGAAGVAVVASGVGGTPEIIQHERSGILITPGDSSGIAEALRSVLTDSDTRAQYARALHEVIATQFSLGQMLNKTEVLYES